MPPRILHVVDAFTHAPFAGNPAAVCLLETQADAAWMQRVAREMNLSETAFLIRRADGFGLRWFTPTVEVRLCGHATLASAHALWETGVLPPTTPARFHTLSGLITCTRDDDWIEMDFPARPCSPCPAPEGLERALGAPLLLCAANGMDYLVEISDAAALRSLQPDLNALAQLPVRGVIVTCASDLPEFDFLSRFFAPAAGVPEDPVTGSAHCALGPFWSDRLDKTALSAFQASARGGVVHLRVEGERVLLRGGAVLMSRVELFH